MLEKILGFVNLGLWLCLFLSMFFAYLRGFRKSVSRFIATIIVIILSFVFTNSLCKSMCTTNFGSLIGQGNMSFVSLIEKLMKEAFGLKKIASDSALKEFCVAAAQSLVKIPIFFGIYSFLITIFRPLIALIIRTLFPIPEGKTVSMRLAAAGVGVFTFFIVIWFWTFTFLGSKGVVQECVQYYNDIVVVNQNNKLDNNSKSELEEIEEALELFDDGSFIRVMTLFSGENNKLEAQLLGKMTTIKTENGELNFVVEFENIMPVVKIFGNARLDDTEALIQYLLSNRELILDTLESSEVINVLFPLGIEILDYTVEEISVDGLKDIVWVEEKINIVNILRTVLNSVVSLNINFDDPITILDNPNFVTCLTQIGQALEKSEIFKEVVLVYANDFIQDMIIEKVGNDYSGLLEVLDLTKIQLGHDLQVVGNVLVDARKIGLFEQKNMKLIENRNIISQMIKSIFSLSTIKGNEAETIKAVLELAKINQKLEDAGITLNLKISNWDIEIERISRAINLLLQIAEENEITTFEGIDIIKLLEEATARPSFDELLDCICNSEVFNKSLISIINKTIDSKELSSLKSEKFIKIVNGEAPLDQNEFKNEIKLILKEIKVIYELSSTGTIDVQKLKAVSLNLCNSTYISMQEIVEIVFDKFINDNNSFEKKIVLPEFTNSEWKDEITSVFEIIDIIQKNGYVEEGFEFSYDEETGNQILDLAQHMNQSDIFRQIMPDLIKKIVPKQEFLSEWLLEQCGVDSANVNKNVASKITWQNEIDKFNNIHDFLLANDVENIDFDDLKDQDYSIIEQMFLLLNNSNCVDCNGIVALMNPLFNDYNLNLEIDKIYDRNNNGSNKDEWEDEIPRLVSAFKSFNTIGEINNDTIQTKHAEIGSLLNNLKTSYIFGNDTRNDGAVTTDDNKFNDLIISVLNAVNLIKNDQNPNGFINEDQANLTDWTVYDWEDELAILTSFDVESETQTMDTIKTVSSSKIVKDFFDIATFLNEKLEGKEMVISKGTFSYTLVLKTYVNNGQPLTNDQLRTRDWAAEIDDMNTIIDIFQSGYRTGFKADLEALIASGHSTLAIETASSIKVNLQLHTHLGVSVWDLI